MFCQSWAYGLRRALHEAEGQDLYREAAPNEQGRARVGNTGEVPHRRPR
jgi:hypothetical protein